MSSLSVTASVITYGYDASGSKLSVTYNMGNGVISKMEYAGNKVYKNGTLGTILTGEGYVTMDGTTPEYHYYLKDHQGNNRVVIDQTGTVLQVNHYYPFGGLFGEGSQTSKQPYKYNGKEFEHLLGLNMYDYGARSYDPYTGGWVNVDPLAEKYYSISPYVYVANNPVRFVDPNGMWIQHSDSTGSYRYSDGQWEKYQTEGENAGKYTVFTPEAGSFLSGVLDGLNALSRNVTGNALLNFFANDENTTTIKSAAVHTKGDVNMADIEESVSGYIWVSSTFQGSLIPTEYGIQTSPFWLDLGHELAHRKDVLMNGAEQAKKEWLRNPDTGGIISQSEKYATHMENMMRADAGLPLRTHYARQGSGGWAPSMILNKGTRTSKFYGTTYRTTPRILIPK